MIAVESRPQKGTLSIQQLVQPHQLVNQLRHVWRQLTSDLQCGGWSGEVWVPLVWVILPPVGSYLTHSLINGSSGCCQCIDWYQNGKASSVNSSHRFHSVACGVQVTDTQLVPTQLPWNSNYLYTKHLINLVKGRRVRSADSWHQWIKTLFGGWWQELQIAFR